MRLVPFLTLLLVLVAGTLVGAGARGWPASSSAPALPGSGSDHRIWGVLPDSPPTPELAFAGWSSVQEDDRDRDDESDREATPLTTRTPGGANAASRALGCLATELSPHAGHPRGCEHPPRA